MKEEPKLDGQTRRRVPMRPLSAIVIVAVIAATFVIGAAESASAWYYGKSATASCVGGKAVINGTFNNNEPENTGTKGDMNVTMIYEAPNPDLADGPKFVRRQTSGSFTINTGQQSLSDGQVKFWMAWADGRPGTDKGYATFKGVTCKTQVTPLPPTSTPEDCYKAGSASLPAQPEGVIVKVNDVVIQTPWTAPGPGTYVIKYYAAQGKELTNDPSTTLVVKDKTPFAECISPTQTGTVSCAGYVFNWSNLKGKLPYNVIVTKTDGTKETVTVPAGGTATRTYPVVEDATSSMKSEAPGLEPLVLSFAADCVPNTPPPVPPTPPTPPVCPPGSPQTDYNHNGVIEPPKECQPVKVVKVRSTLESNCLTARLGEFSAYVKNYGISTSPVWVKVFVNGNLDAHKKLRPGKSYGANAIVNVGSKVRLVIKTKSGMLDVKRTTVPDGCGGKTHDGGLRTQQSAAG